MESNVIALHKHDTVHFPQSQLTFTPVVVDSQEITRLERRLTKLVEQEKRNITKAAVTFTNKKGKIDTRTMAYFLEKGLPHTMKGLTSLLKVHDYSTRLAGLQKLEACYEILKRGTTVSGEMHTSYQDVTDRDVNEMQAHIKQHADNYQPSAY